MISSPLTVAERIGDHLVRLGLVTTSDVEDAAMSARGWRVRLASALVRLGRVSEDDASRALAAQHGVPAALRKHLDGRDLALVPTLPAAVARELCALPLAVSRGSGALVVCVRDPSPATAAALAHAAGKPIVLAVAAECVLGPLIAESYPEEQVVELDAVEDPSGAIEVDLDTSGSAFTASGAYDVDSLQLVDLDDHGVSKDHHQIAPRLPALPPRITAPFAAAGANPKVERARRPSALQPRRLALDPALVAITRAEQGDAVVESVLAYLRHRFEVGVIFVVKDGCALGQAGFGGDLDDDSVEALVVPLTQRSVLRIAHDTREPFLGAPTETGVVQDRFFRVIGATPATAVVVPVVIRDRVINLVYAHGARDGSDTAAANELRMVASAAEDALVRIIREAKEA